MRIASLFLGAICAVVTLNAAAQSPSAADVAKAQAEATKAVSQMRGLSAVRDANGQALYNSDGTLQTTSSSQTTKANDLEYFKGLTGLEGLEQLSSPAKDGRTGLVSVSTNQSFDLVCNAASSGLVRTAGGLTFKVVGCNGGASPSTISFAVCDAQLRTSQCAANSDFSQMSNVPVGSFTTISGLQVGAGCNSTGTCRVSVKGTQSLGGNDASLKQQGQQLAAQSSMVGDLRQNVESGTYSQKMQEVGRPLMDCAERNRASMAANGTVSGCGDEGAQAVVAVKPGQSQQAAECTGERQCLRWGTSSQTFARSCTRTFPLTERVTKYSFNTQQCDISETTSAEGKVTRTNSCVQGTTDVSADMNKVGDTDKQCTVRSADGAQCLTQTWTEYFATKDPGILSTFDSPSPVAGACDTNPLSQTRYTSYEGGSWFGRTLPDEQCMTEVIDDAAGGTGMFIQITNTEKAGCGIYTTPSVGTTCYGQPSMTDDVDSCGQMDLAGCQMVSSIPASYTGGNGGLVMSQQESYQCQHTQNTCLEWSKGSGDAACMSTGDMTFGTDSTKSAMNDGSGMNAALVAAAIVDASAEGVDNNANPLVPLIFTGEDMRCKRATGGIGQLFGRNCCRMDLERPISGQWTRDGCGMDETKLAAARRSNYTVYLGDYCSKKMKFPSRCLQRTETYCTFSGILPRLIHEQGRGQLATMAASGVGANVVRQNLNFSYLDGGDGHWSPPLNVNGVMLTAWQWPSYCADPEKAGERLASDPNALECPGVVHTTFASCDVASGCGNLPPSPEYGSGEWSLIDVNPLEKNTTAVSRYAVVSGACSTVNGMCQYEASAWPIGQGGKAVITRDIAWQLYSNEAPDTTAASAVSQMTNMADLMFRTWSTPGLADGKTVPSTIRIDFSHDGGQSWQTVQVPTDLRDQDYTFPNSDTRMSGRCEALTNLCSFRVTGTMVIFAKPWGSAQNPECSGFTPGQLSAMDFSKMDLSEWLSTVMDKAASANPTALAQEASKQFQDFNSLFQEGQGTLTVSTPTTANFARITPAQGFGPFNTKLVVSGYWPQTTGDPAVDVDRVQQVDVDWGDCTLPETLLPLAFNTVGSGYSGVHTFQAPDQLACGAREANVKQTIKLTIYTTKSGVQTRALTVENAWSKFPGADGGNNVNVPMEVSAPVNQGIPSAPQPR